MSEALIRWLADRQSVAFLLLLASLVGFLSLMAAFYGAVHFSPEKQGG